MQNNTTPRNIALQHGTMSPDVAVSGSIITTMSNSKLQDNNTLGGSFIIIDLNTKYRLCMVCTRPTALCLETPNGSNPE